MIRFVVFACLLAGAGCRISLANNGNDHFACKVDNASPQCVDAVGKQDLKWIEDNVFALSCNFSGCHNGTTSGVPLDLRSGKSSSHLVNVASHIDSTRKLVVPMDVDQSYLMVMLAAIPPEMADPPTTLPSAGLMPQGGSGVLCCQKLDAIERWINAGAPTN